VHARRAASTEHALHYVLERVYSAWSEGKISSILLLDISGAFDKVSQPRLLYNLRKKGIDDRIVRWIESFLSNCTAILRTNEHTTNKVDISMDIPQGSSLSPILFLFYIAPLLEELQRKNIEACGSVDDTALIIKSNSARRNCEMPSNINEEICMSWASTHGVKFAPNKYQLCHLTRKRQSPTDDITINDNISVAPKETVKYLGVWLDCKLNWKAQVNSNKTRALKTELFPVSQAPHGAPSLQG